MLLDLVDVVDGVLLGFAGNVAPCVVVVTCLGTAPVLRFVSHSFFIIIFTGGVGAIRKYIVCTYTTCTVNNAKLTLTEYSAATVSISFFIHF